MIYLIFGLLLFAAVAVGWKLTSRNAYESAAYSVIESHGKIELREYPDLMLVTTEMGTRVQGDDGSFGRLFKYISGGNESKQKVAMTTPVFMDPQSEQSTGQMGFVIPTEVAASSIPNPTNERVRLTKRLGGKFAVARFPGRLSKDLQARQQSKLENWIVKSGYVAAGPPEVAGYDPPWTPGPFRRNEILIRVEK